MFKHRIWWHPSNKFFFSLILMVVDPRLSPIIWKIKILVRKPNLSWLDRRHEKGMAQIPWPTKLIKAVT
jgi:hypothetical protein